MKIGIIGLASRYWPGAFADRLRTMADVELVGAAYCERDDAFIAASLGSSKEAFAERYGIPLFAHPGELLAAQHADAVVICEETSQQYRYVEQAAAAGVPCFIAKPMAATLAAADRMVAAVERADIVASTGSTQRFDGALRQVWERVRQGEIGDVVSIRVMHQHGNLDAFGPDDWYRRPENGGPELSLFWYAVDCLRWLTGKEVAAVYAQYDNFLWPQSPFFDNAKALLRFADGTLGSIDAYFSMRWRYPSWEVELVGSKGAIKTTQSTFEGALYSADGVAGFYRSQNDHLAAELRHWLGACRGKWPPEVTLADARRTIEASLACLKSAQSGQPVALPIAADEPLIAGRERYARVGG
jgi:predicted dehydrogenase